MKIAVVNNWAPFIVGGAEHLAKALTAKLNEFGHQALSLRIPFQWNPPEKIVDSVLACKLMRLEGFDRVIPLKFPVYCIPHAERVLWLLHQFRQAYDLRDTAYQHIPDTPEGNQILKTIISSDNNSLSSAKRIFTNSYVTSDRLKNFNGISSQVLYPPLFQSDHFLTGPFGDHLFYPSRINKGKRQYLAVDAMAHVKTGAKLVIAGHPETQDDLEDLERRIESCHLRGKVTVIPRFISEAEKVDLFKDALGCVYIPYDEDSYGYVTLESYHSHKPVITCSDSGGTSIVVRDAETGFVVPPDPLRLAEAIDRLYMNKVLARDMGEAGFLHMLQLGITWERVIDCLTSRA